MKQYKDNCLYWQLAKRLVQCYWQPYLSCSVQPQTAFLCVKVCACVFVELKRGGQAGALQRSIDFYIRDITPNWVSGLPLPCTVVVFIPLLLSLPFKRNRNGASGTIEYMYNHQPWINRRF